MPELVCPITHEHFVEISPKSLVTAKGRRYDVINGIPNLTVIEPPSKWLHHYRRREFGPERILPRPSPTVKFVGDRYYLVGSYEDYIYSINRRVNPILEWLLRRIAIYSGLFRMVRQQKRVIKAMVRELENEFSSLSKEEVLDFTKMIHGLEGHPATNLTRRLEKELFWDHVEILHPALEVGVGYGEISNYLFKDRGIEFGSEYDFREFVNPARYPYKKLLGANFKYLPFPSNSLRTIVSSRTLYFVRSSIVSILREVNRVLKMDGRFAFTVTGPAFVRVLPEDKGLPQYGMSPYHCLVHNELHSWYMSHLYTMEEWREILQACGFEVLISRGIYSFRYSRFVEIFYNYGSSWYSLFTERFNPPRLSIPTNFLFGGRKAKERYKHWLNQIMSVVYKKEKETPTTSWNDETHLMGGIVAVKRRDITEIIK